ncbi:hypothetical protein QT998_24885 [Microcoleus sp. S1D4]|uniref:hypothetical protein n=1 Tax=unclassified Microcoleus TaxID=2642155 RepID=UPI002FD093E7
MNRFSALMAGIADYNYRSPFICIINHKSLDPNNFKTAQVQIGFHLAIAAASQKYK